MNDRKRGPAARVLKAGKIFVSDRKPPIACTVRSASDSGALLIVGSGTFGIPAEFELAVGDGPRRACRSAWRDLNSIEVEFV